MNPKHELSPDEIRAQARVQEGIDSDTWDLKEISRILIHHKWFVIYCTVSFLVLSIIYALFWPKTYEAVSTVELPASSAESTDSAIRDLASLPSTGDPIQTYIDVAQSNTIAAYAIQKLDLLNNQIFQKFSLRDFTYKKTTKEKLIAYLLKKIVTIKNSKESDLLGVQIDVPKDPKLAADLANAWVEGFIKVNLSISQESARLEYEFVHNQLAVMRAKLEHDRTIKKNYLNPSNEAQSNEIVYNLLLQQDQQSQIQANEDNSGIVVVDRAEIPENPSWPLLIICIFLGLFLGLVAGIQGALLKNKFQNKIKTAEDLTNTSGLTLLAHIPNFRRDHGKLIFSPSDLFSPKHLIGNPQFEFSPYKESFKIFRTNLTFSKIDQNMRAIGTFSPNPSEGKTLVNADLALSLSETGKKVLLVDADLRKPTIGILFGVKTPENSGLPMLLAGKSKLADIVVPSGFQNLYLLPNNVIPPNPVELLGSETMKKVIDEMKSQYDYVIFDGAPINPVADSVVLSTKLDGVILLGRWDQTRKADLRQAFQQLRAVQVTMLGTVLNAIEMERGLYGYGYGYGYGKYGYGQKSKDQKVKKN